MADEEQSKEVEQDAGPEVEPVSEPASPEQAPSEPDVMEVDPEPDLAEREAREAAFLEQKARGGAEVPGWPGVKVETPEEHDARRKAEASSFA